MSINWDDQTAKISQLSEIPALEITKNIARADDESLQNLHPAVQEVADLYEKALSFLIENLKGVDSIRAEWASLDGFRAAVAMLGAATNYLFAARQLLFRGYFVETEILLREVEDRAARALVFQADEDAVRRFLNGDRLYPSDIGKRLKNLLKEANSADESSFLADLRDSYKNKSNRGHANLSSLRERTPVEEKDEEVASDGSKWLSDNVGNDVFIGGFRGPVMQAALILHGIKSSIFVAGVFSVMSTDADGRWHDGVVELEREYTELMVKMKAVSDN